MFLDVRELERDQILFRESLPPGRIDFGQDVWQVEPLGVRGSAELLASEIHLRGHLRTAVEVPCARCLERSRRPVELDFDLFYRSIQSIAREEDVAIKPSELDVGFYQGHGLLLEDVLKEQILLSLPMKSICRPDCAGLCPQCGQNRNLADCGCRPADTDGRWAPLARLKAVTSDE
jgi:uncharacterized protein